MRKPLPNKIEAEDLLKGFLEESLPHEDLEIFMDDNNLSQFSFEITRRENQALTISSVYIIE